MRERPPEPREPDEAKPRDVANPRHKRYPDARVMVERDTRGVR